MDKRNLAVIVIAQNEAANIEQCLNSVVGWARQVYVVDSFSTDHTAVLARATGAEVVQHQFVDWASQRNWALANLPLASDWVFFLDADEAVPPDFKRELARLLVAGPTDLAGIYVRFTFWFLGRKLHYAYEAPPVMRLIRPRRASWRGEGAREYCTVEGATAIIQARLLHRDLKSLSHWIEKQNRNAGREAEVLRQATRPTVSLSARTERAGRIWLRQAVYNRLPPVVRPVLYFVYRYLFRLGFLDGLAGFAYCFLQGFWYPLLVDLILVDLQGQRQEQAPQRNVTAADYRPLTTDKQ